MSLVVPVLYHWAPTSRRAGITRRGLIPRCPTGANFHPDGSLVDDPHESFLAVCLGTSPSHAWHLSGGITASHGDSWDLWQVVLDDDDQVHPLPLEGYRLDEFRVANRIPKRQVWYVATRVVADRRRRRWREDHDGQGGLRRVPA